MKEFYCAMCGKEHKTFDETLSHLLDKHSLAFIDFPIDPRNSVIESDKTVEFYVNDEKIGKRLNENNFLWEISFSDLALKLLNSKRDGTNFEITDNERNNYSFDQFIKETKHYAVFPIRGYW